MIIELNDKTTYQVIALNTEHIVSVSITPTNDTVIMMLNSNVIFVQESYIEVIQILDDISAQRKADQIDILYQALIQSGR